MSSIGFDKKLYIGSFGIILLTILLIAVINFNQSKRSFLYKGETSVQNVSDVLLKAIQLKYEMQSDVITSEIGALVSESLFSGSVYVGSKPLTMKIYDVKTPNNKTATEIPELIFGMDPAAEHLTVDTAARFSTSEFATYQVFENKLIKITTNLKNKDESRPIGGYYSENTGRYKAVMSGKQTQFIKKIGEGYYLELLQPFEDGNKGGVVGAYSITSKILTKSLVELVSKVNVNGLGFSFACHPDGEILVHPDKAYLSLKVQKFENGKAVLGGKSGPVVFKHEKKNYYAYVNYFKPWNLYFTVAVSEKDLMAGVNKQIVTSSFISGVLALIVGALIIGFMNRQLINNMKGMATMAKEVARGNFKHTFAYTANDAIKETVDAMNEMVDGLADMVKELNAGVHALSSASGELNQMSDHMNEGSETMVTKVNVVATAAEEMSVNMDSVAAAMEEASTNVRIVSLSANDMNTSLGQVNQNSNKTRKISNQAVELARQTSERVSELSKAAEEIDKVTDTINSISSQTNLLALNATIEAARAGEAGKGFAVVANEIKELAGQTAGATEDIAKNIQEIQERIAGAVTEIHRVSEIITRINDYVTEASDAIECQSGTTGEIAENVSQITLGIQEVNVNVNESSEVSGKVSEELNDVLMASEEINSFSHTVKEKVKILNDVMLKLKAITEKFEI